MDSLEIINKFCNSELRWLPELGIGYYPVTAMPYNKKYFIDYMNLKDTPIGLALNKARTELVNKYTKDKVLDIGIGNGAFVEGRENTFGYDINPHAVEWLVLAKKFLHPFRGANSLTFWDSLEHIHNPKMILQGAKEYVFISCPIYDNVEHILGSKHFKKDEHCWYWTVEGLNTFMSAFGFEIQEVNWMESDIGREDIGTFVFKRVN